MHVFWIVGGEDYIHFPNTVIDYFISLHFKADSVWTYFNNLHEEDFPRPQKLFQAALSLYDNYSTPRAGGIFMTECQPDSSITPIGEPWKEEEDTEPNSVAVEAEDTDAEEGDRDNEDEGKEGPGKRKDEVEEFDGDHTLARSALFMYEALVSKEVAQAVAEGDIGRVYEGMKVSHWFDSGLKSLTQW